MHNRPVIAQTFTVFGANAYVNRQDWNGLLHYSQSWTKAEPRNATAWYYLGRVYALGLHRVPESIPYFEQAARLNPDWPEAWDALGHVYGVVGRNQEAASAFQRASHLGSSDLTHWNNLAATYANSGDYEKAEQTLDEGQRVAGTRYTTQDWYVAGNAYNKLRLFAKAVAAYRQALKISPNWGACWTNLGVAQQMNGDPTSAMASYHKGFSLGNQLAQENINALTPHPSNSSNPYAAFDDAYPGGTRSHSSISYPIF
jgi:tetratricopeptide (TPR) repeat protein